LLVIDGPPGTGKTQSVKKVMKDGYLLINTHITPLFAYKVLYDFRNKPVVIDDIDNLIQNSKLVSLFKQCGETTKEKTLQWNSTSNQLGDYPSRFETTSNLLLTVNRIYTDKNLNRLALLDRGFHVEFEPQREEILNRMKEISEKATIEGKWDIYNFIKEHIDFASNVNLRTLIKGFSLKNYGKSNWQEILKNIMGVDERLKEVSDLLKKYNTEEAVKHYSRSRADFFRKKNELENKTRR